MAASLLTRSLQTTAGWSYRTLWQLVLSSHYSIDEHLSKHEYWKQRYTQTTSTDLSFDWFLGSQEILDFFLDSMEHFSQDRKCWLSCLDLGCGTSSVSKAILANSPMAVRLVLLDFVQEALQYQKQHMNTGSARVPDSRCHFVCADVTCLPFCDFSFNMAVDKGTMDALLKDKVKGHTKAVAMMSEVKRILISGGRFVQISDEDPDTRLTFLDGLSHTYCDVTDSHFMSQLPDNHCSPAGMDRSIEDHSSSDTVRNNISTDHVSRNLFSAWSFQVIPSRWHKEYFIYWTDKL